MSRGYDDAMARLKPKTADDVPHARIEVRNDGNVPRAVYHVRRKHFISFDPGQTKSIVVQFKEAQIMQVAALMTRMTVLSVEKLTDHIDSDALSAPDYRPNGVLERKHGNVSSQVASEVRAWSRRKRHESAG
jgi:hypothetical protein